KRKHPAKAVSVRMTRARRLIIFLKIEAKGCGVGVAHSLRPYRKGWVSAPSHFHGLPHRSHPERSRRDPCALHRGKHAPPNSLRAAATKRAKAAVALVGVWRTAAATHLETIVVYIRPEVCDA